MEEERLKKIINDSEKSFRTCFQVLASMKEGNIQSPDDIFSFQPRLATCLYDLQQFYGLLIKEEKNRIKEKGRYTLEQFKELMVKLSRQKEVVSDAITLGKTLGDSFAWFFFRRSHSSLDEHYEHQENKLFVGGIGGKGEVEFIKATSMIDGLFVIYHSVTNLLRISDFSLCTAHGEVIGIGELKTVKTGDRYSIRAHISSLAKIEIPDDNAEDLAGDAEAEKLFVSVINQERLAKQIEKQNMLLDKQKEGTNKHNVFLDPEYELLKITNPEEGVVRVNNDKCLVYYGLPSLCNNLYSALTQENGALEINFEQELLDCVNQITHKESHYSEIIIGSFDCKFWAGRKPILWWNLDIKSIELIIFKQYLFFSLYNPSSFIEALELEGYITMRTLPQEKRKNGYEFKKPMSKGEMLLPSEFYNYAYYMVVEELFPIEAIIKIIASLEKEMIKGDVFGKVKLALHPMFGRPDDEE